MIETEKRYIADNFPVLHNSIVRGEFFYHIRLYSLRAEYLSVKSGLLRMRMILALLEARVCVIDAVIKNDSHLDYLSVICSSTAQPTIFSNIVQKSVPTAIIEQIHSKRAEEYISYGALRDTSWNIIPHRGVIRGVHESRRILLGLLLEYRALLAEYNAIMPSNECITTVRSSKEYHIPFLLFEYNGLLCGIPEYQVDVIEKGSGNSKIISLHQTFGQKVLICDDIICIKEIDVPNCVFSGRTRKAHYPITVPLCEGSFSFTLIIPSLLS